MGLITQQLTDSDKFVKPSGSENKSGPGMKNNEAGLTSREEKGAGTAVEKTTQDGKRYILADGPASNLFTKALQVKFNKSDAHAELSNNRPVQAQVESSDKEVDNIKQNQSNESYAQDAYIQASRNNHGIYIQEVDANTSRFRISRTTGNPRDPITVNPVYAFKELADTGIDVDFVMVKSEGPDGDVNTELMSPEVIEKTSVSKNAVGGVDDIISNENLEIMSVEVIVKYR